MYIEYEYGLISGQSWIYNTDDESIEGNSSPSTIGREFWVGVIQVKVMGEVVGALVYSGAEVFVCRAKLWKQASGKCLIQS